jgi:hypothetical protein
MSMPPGQPPGSYRPPYGLPQQHPPPARRRAWPRRHPIWSAVIALFVLLVIIGATTSPAPAAKTSHTAAAAARKTVKPARLPLRCGARALRWRPLDHTAVGIMVRTAVHAQVNATAPISSLSAETATGPASAQGVRMLRFRVGDTAPGARVVIVVHVSSNGQTGTCRAFLRPRPAPAAVVKAPVQPAATPSSTPPPPPAATTSPPPAATTSCHPLSDEGTCYEPGEYCRASDQGVTGIAGDGETITCEDNDGLRWEPS